MLIAKGITAPNGTPLTVHMLAQVIMEPNRGVAVVNSYTGNGTDMVAWQERYNVDQSLSFADVGTWLISPLGPLSGGTIIAEQTPLAQAQDALWSKAKGLRDQIRFGGCETPYGWIQTTLESIVFISGAVQASDKQGDAFSMSWTMLDNSIHVFNHAEMVEVGLLVAAHASLCQDASEATRAKIYAATSEEALMNINIAEGLPPPPPIDISAPDVSSLGMPVATGE